MQRYTLFPKYPNYRPSFYVLPFLSEPAVLSANGMNGHMFICGFGSSNPLGVSRMDVSV